MQNAEDQLAILVDPESVTVDIADMKGDINQLKIDVTGLQQNTTAIDTSLNNMYITQNNFQVGLNGLSNRLTTVESSQSSLDSSMIYVREQQSLLTQQIDNINLRVKDVIVGGENLLNSTDFGVIPDESVKADWFCQSSWKSYHPSGLRSSLIAPNEHSPVADAGYFECYTDVNNVSGATDFYHLDTTSNVWLFELLRQPITGKLKPATWYTLSFYTYLHDFEYLITYVYPSVGDYNYKYYVNGKDAGYTPSDTNVG